MTKKLKKKFNRIAIFALAVLASVIVVLGINTNVFVIPMNQDTLDTSGVAETTDGEVKMVTYSGVSPLSDGGVIECESIVQGARDNNLSDRKLHIQGSRNR